MLYHDKMSCQWVSDRKRVLPHNDIGAAIKELRKALGDISQERFARRLGTTTRTISRWEAAEALSPQILSRLRSIAISVGAHDAADFFESKLREDLDWETDGSEDQAIPSTLEEHAIVSEFLKRYRANDPAIQPLIEEFLISTVANLRLKTLQIERHQGKQQFSLAGLMRRQPPAEPTVSNRQQETSGQPKSEPRQTLRDLMPKSEPMRTLRDLMNASPSTSDADIVRAFLSGRSRGKTLNDEAGLARGKKEKK